MSEPLGQIVGSNVSRLREEQGLGKTAFCLMAGISRPYLNRIESGTANITLKELQRLADSLDVAPEQLLAEPRD